MGALLRITTGDSLPDQIWRKLRMLFGGIEEIPGVLASIFRTSLLRSYRNIERRSATRHA